MPGTPTDLWNQKKEAQCQGCELTLAVTAYLQWIKGTLVYSPYDLAWYRQWMAEALVRVNSHPSEWISR